MTDEGEWPAYTPDALLHSQGKSPLYVPVNMRAHRPQIQCDSWENRKFSLPEIEI
jgi:hypothetical protein